MLARNEHINKSSQVICPLVYEYMHASHPYRRVRAYLLKLSKSLFTENGDIKKQKLMAVLNKEAAVKFQIFEAT